MPSTFYLDPQNGSDANDGSNWANAWKTITSGATAARIGAGDIIKIAKSPDPTSLGTGTWTNGPPVTATKSITNATNATPIVITASSHGYSDGDAIWITGVGGNIAANGLWRITYIDTNSFSLDGSIGSGAYTSGGTATNYNARCVRLSSSCFLEVGSTDFIWTSNDVTNITPSVETTIKKKGYGSCKLVFGANATTGLSAYYPITSVDLSGYQQLTFWVYCSVTLAAGDFRINLCSDAAGATPQDSFDIPAVPTASKWIAFTVNKGSAMYNGIQSVSLYQMVDKGALTIYLDNICAVKATTDADSLSLTSLISKNSAAQGGTEGWYSIAAMRGGKVLLLESTPDQSIGTLTRGYTGTSESVTTYKRECYRNTTGETVQDSGSLGSLIEFQGGYNTSSGDQDGETFWDGGNCQTNGLTCSKNFVKINRLNFVRYSAGIDGNPAVGCIFDQIQSLNNNYLSFYLRGGSYKNLINWIGNINNCLNYGIALINAFSNVFVSIGSINNTYSGSYGALWFQTNADYNIFQSITSIQNSGGKPWYFYDKCNHNKFWNIGTQQNNASASAFSIGVNYLFNWNCGDSSEAPVTGGGMVFSQKHDTTAANHWVFYNGGTCNLQTTTMHGTIGAWKFIISNSIRDSQFPLSLPLVRVQVSSGVTYTVRAWCKLDHASQIGAKLVCRGGQVAGVASDVTDTKTGDTDWEQLSVSFTPSENGIVEIEGHVYYLTANNNAYFDSELSVETA